MSRAYLITSPCKVDSDGDGFADLPSTSHQGPANTAVTSDNCPNVANPAHLNTDGNFVDQTPPKAFDDITWPNSDQYGDACDADDDNDGLTDTAETSGPPCGSASAATNPLVRDTDGDRVLDGAECALGFDPASAASVPPLMPAGDTDHDGLTDAYETTIGTSPLVADTDGDKIVDGLEVKNYNTDPLSTNTDGDPCGDGKEIGSVNMDTKVNSTDQLAVALSFGTAPGPPYYEPFDLNKDAKVNSTDQLLQAKVYGSFCP